ncbi:hypothetical protein RIF29_38322 [Crotalaria pallida]|uniref:Uncharacterized protein n=1 Tax=Crotalaria pallida TaxID=3830 RepID=A0AAN9DZ34_CROPI
MAQLKEVPLVKEVFEPIHERKRKKEIINETLESEMLKSETFVEVKENMSETLEGEMLESETLVRKNEEQSCKNEVPMGYTHHCLICED